MISADIVLLVESNPTFRITLYSLVAIGIHAIDLPLLPVTARILLSIVGCSQSIVCGQHRTRSLDNEVCAISCLTFISVGQAITPLGRYIAIKKQRQVLTTCHLSSLEDIEAYRFVNASTSISKVFEILLEVTIRTKTPFTHLLINIGTLHSLLNLNPEILESGCCRLAEVECDFLGVCCRQGLIFLIVDECPSFAIANSQVVACEVTAINLPCSPVTARIATCIVTCNKEVVLGDYSLLCLNDNIADVAGIFRVRRPRFRITQAWIEPATPLCSDICIDQTLVVFAATRPSINARQSGEWNVLRQCTLTGKHHHHSEEAEPKSA